MELNNFIPLDKSWIIRMGVLDITNGYNDIHNFLKEQRGLGTDLLALRNATEKWNTKEKINVGESGTLYRFLQFASWKQGLHKEFIKQGTLKTREITNDWHITQHPVKNLLMLDNGTSQWASAAVLLGANETVKNPPYKLNVTYEAIKHWKEQRQLGKTWEAKVDETIRKQAETFVKILEKKRFEFKPEQAEDYCFARAFGIITKEEGLEKWPQLVNHESNRITEMEKCLTNYYEGENIDSQDHRVIQAIAMKALSEGKEIEFEHPESVEKSWPQFWEFITYLKENTE